MRYILLILASLLCTTHIHAQEFPYSGMDAEYYFDSPVDMGSELAAATTDDEDSLLNQFLSMYELDSYDGPDKALHYAKGIINLILSLSSFVVFAWILYGFYSMFFASHEEGISRARKIIKVCAIALVLIALSWIITSFLFYLYYVVTGGVP